MNVIFVNILMIGRFLSCARWSITQLCALQMGLWRKFNLPSGWTNSTVVSVPVVLSGLWNVPTHRHSSCTARRCERGYTQTRWDRRGRGRVRITGHFAGSVALGKGSCISLVGSCLGSQKTDTSEAHLTAQGRWNGLTPPRGEIGGKKYD